MNRIVALDFARFLAVVGMMGAHLLLPDAPGWLRIAVTGFPSTAFAVIGGVSAILATRRYSDEGRHLAAAISLASRGAVIAVLGLALQPLGHPVIVVLTYFGAGLVCLSPLLRLPAWAMLAGAGVLAIGGGAVNIAVRDGLGHPDSEAISFESPIHFLASLGFTGTYPVVTWLAYLLLGAAIGRMLATSRAPTVRAGLLLTSAGAAALAASVIADAVGGHPRAPGVEADGAPVGTGIRMLLDATPHSGSLGDMVRTASAACLALGLLLVLTRAGGRAPMLLRPLRAAGGAPLTVYTLHVLAFGAALTVAVSLGDPDLFDDDGFPWWLGGTGIWLVHIAGALGIGALLAALHRRGPLEAGVGAIAARAAVLTPRARALN